MSWRVVTQLIHAVPGAAEIAKHCAEGGGTCLSQIHAPPTNSVDICHSVAENCYHIISSLTV